MTVNKTLWERDISSLVHFQVFSESLVSGRQTGCRTTGKPGVDDAMNMKAAIENTAGCHDNRVDQVSKRFELVLAVVAVDRKLLPGACRVCSLKQ